MLSVAKNTQTKPNQTNQICALFSITLSQYLLQEEKKTPGTAEQKPSFIKMPNS